MTHFSELKTYFIRVVPLSGQDEVVMYAGLAMAGPESYKSSVRCWEQHRFHLLQTAGVEADIVEKIGPRLLEGQETRIPDVALLEEQLNQLGFTTCAEHSSIAS